MDAPNPEIPAGTGPPRVGGTPADPSKEEILDLFRRYRRTLGAMRDSVERGALTFPSEDAGAAGADVA